jgi:hypothetical protein
MSDAREHAMQLVAQGEHIVAVDELTSEIRRILDAAWDKELELDSTSVMLIKAKTKTTTQST